MYILYEKRIKFFAEKFGGKEKMSTFAIPNEKRGNKNLEFGKRSSLKRLITVQEASTEKYNLSRSVNSFVRIRSVSDKLRII